MTYKNYDDGRVVEHYGKLYRWVLTGKRRLSLVKLADEQGDAFREQVLGGAA